MRAVYGIAALISMVAVGVSGREWLSYPSGQAQPLTGVSTGQPCTEDAKVCPDGTFVVRDEENDCDFATCPSVVPQGPCIPGVPEYREMATHCRKEVIAMSCFCEQLRTVLPGPVDAALEDPQGTIVPPEPRGMWMCAVIDHAPCCAEYSSSGCDACTSMPTCVWTASQCSDRCFADVACYDGQQEATCPVSDAVCKERTGCLDCTKVGCIYQEGECRSECAFGPLGSFIAPCFNRKSANECDDAAPIDDCSKVLCEVCPSYMEHDSEGGCCACKPKEPRACCKALTLPCLACSAGIREQEYCAQHPGTIGCRCDGTRYGCCDGDDLQTGEPKNDEVGTNCVPLSTPPPPICCMAMTASCLACSAGVTQADYCALNPGTDGCKPPPICCMAMTASCRACSAGVTQADYCALNPGTDGCKPPPTPLSPVGKAPEIKSGTHGKGGVNKPVKGKGGGKGGKAKANAKGGKGQGKGKGKGNGQIEMELCTGCCPAGANCFAPDPPCCAANVGALKGVGQASANRPSESTSPLQGLHPELLAMVFVLIGTSATVIGWFQYHRVQAATDEDQPLVSGLAK